jgi:hypothetical protein
MLLVPFTSSGSTGRARPSQAIDVNLQLSDSEGAIVYSPRRFPRRRVEERLGEHALRFTGRDDIGG